MSNRTATYKPDPLGLLGDSTPAAASSRTRPDPLGLLDTRTPAPAARAPAPAGKEPGLIDEWINSAGRGVNRMTQAGAVLAGSVGMMDPQAVARSVAEDEADIARYPLSRETEQGLIDITQAEGFGEAMLAAIRNPQSIATVIAQSLPMSAPSLVGGAAGALAAGPAGAVVGGGVGSFATEFAVSMHDALASAGYDVENPAAVSAAFADPEVMSAAREHATRRGVPIAAFDALSFGLAGKLYGPASRAVGGATRPVRGAIAGAGAELVPQAGAGAAGEAAAQILTSPTGEISSPGEILLEGLAEIPGTVAEPLVKSAFSPRTAREDTPPPAPGAVAPPAATPPPGTLQEPAAGAPAPTAPPPPAAPADAAAAQPTPLPETSPAAPPGPPAPAFSDVEIRAPSGEAFATQRGAELHARMKGITGYEAVQTDEGWVLRRPGFKADLGAPMFDPLPSAPAPAVPAPVSAPAPADAAPEAPTGAAPALAMPAQSTPEERTRVLAALEAAQAAPVASQPVPPAAPVADSTTPGAIATDPVAPAAVPREAAPAPAPAPQDQLTEAEKKKAERAEKSRTRALADRQVSKGDDLLAAIAKLGGLNRDIAEAEGVDPAERDRRGHKIFRVFTKAGVPPDEMMQRLADHGFDFEGYDGVGYNKLLRALSDALGGKRIVSGLGLEDDVARRIADFEDAQAQYADYLEAAPSDTLAGDPRDDMDPGAMLADPDEYAAQDDVFARRVFELARRADQIDDGAGERILDEAARRDLDNEATIESLEEFLRDRTGGVGAQAPARGEGRGAPAPVAEPDAQATRERAAEPAPARTSDREEVAEPALEAAGAPGDDVPFSRRWFGDSKVVDENGEPLVVYHGTERHGLPEGSAIMAGRFVLTEGKFRAEPTRLRHGTGGKGAGLPVQGVREATSAMRLRWARGAKPPVKVVETSADLSYEIPAQHGDLTDVEGATFDGVIYLVAENIYSPEHARLVLAHEAGGHWAMYDILDPGEIAQIEATVLLLRDADNKRVQRIAQEVYERYGRDVDESTFAKEFLAVMVEQRVQAGALKKLWRILREAATRFLNSMGVRRGVTDADLDVFLSAMGRYLETGDAQSARERSGFAGDQRGDNRTADLFGPLASQRARPEPRAAAQTDMFGAPTREDESVSRRQAVERERVERDRAAARQRDEAASASDGPLFAQAEREASGQQDLAPANAPGATTAQGKALRDRVEAVTPEQVAEAYPPTTRTEDWGNNRGQGRRSGSMVRGGMADPPRGVRTYVDPLGALPPAESREVRESISEYGGARPMYLRARTAGLTHDQALTVAYVADGEVTWDRAAELIAERTEEPEQGPASSEPPPAPEPESDLAGPVPASEPEGGKIADVGDDLWYNRRNVLARALAWDDVKGLNDALKVKEVTKAKVWPRPDYEQLVRDGMNPLTAHMMKQVYDAIAAKPPGTSDAQLELYIATLGKVREALYAWARDEATFLEQVRTQAERAAGSARAGRISLMSFTDEARTSAALIDALWPVSDPRAARRRFSDNETARREALAIGGNKAIRAMQFGMGDFVKAMKAIEAGWPGKREAWQQRGITVSKPEVAVRATPQVAARADLWAIEIDGRYLTYARSEAEARALVAEWKPWLVRDKRGRVIATAGTEKEAILKAREHVKRDASSGRDMRGMNIAAAQRTGPQRRGANEDVSPERLMEEFGFRGVNFGREGWINQVERQAFLNHAYDALVDLAEVLDLPARALSLNGMLGIAFGAQGRGGNAAAHFVPGVNEINLTKTMGAGTLAHEWGHALDHYFAVQAGHAKRANPFLSDYPRAARDGAEVRPEIVDAFDTIRRAMEKRASTPEEDEAARVAVLERSRRNLESRLRNYRANYIGDDPAHVAEFERIAERLRAGDVGDGYVESGKKVLPPVPAQLRALSKAAKGRLAPHDETDWIGSDARAIAHTREAGKATRLHSPQVDTTYRRESRRADADKGGKDYWATPWEMFARAFESYVADQITGRGQVNTFLSDAQIRAEARDAEGNYASPYPRGAEREAINTAFDTLVGRIEHRETDRGVALFSRSGSAARPHAEAPTFYSQMTRVLAANLPGKGAAPQFAQAVESYAKKGLFKREELDWSGLMDWLAEQSGPDMDGRVTRDEVIAFVRANEVQVQEVAYGGGDASVAQSELARSSVNAGKYGEYTLPGGEDYRELLLTLPQPATNKVVPHPRGSGYAVQRPDGSYVVNPPNAARNAGQPTLWDTRELAEKWGLPEIGRREGTEYRSSHWDEPNILAHARFNTRTDADGARVLFIEEVQSDWHQAGREHGYGENPKPGWTSVGGEKVPDAPFKKSWPMLAMKRMIRYAAENGYDRIAWTTGAQQARRYKDQVRQIERVEWEPGNETGDRRVEFVAAAGGERVVAQAGPDGVLKRVSMSALDGKALADVAGKEIAERVMASDRGTLDTTDITIGGEGMRGFYDQILPAEVSKYVKKWGAKVGRAEIAFGDVAAVSPGTYTAERYARAAGFALDDLGLSPETEVHVLRDGSVQADIGGGQVADVFGGAARNPRPIPVHAIDITDEMYEAALQGQPLFSRRGGTSTAGAPTAPGQTAGGTVNPPGPPLGSTPTAPPAGSTAHLESLIAKAAGPKPATFAERWRAFKDGLRDRVVQAGIDDLHGLRRLERAAGIAEDEMAAVRAQLARGTDTRVWVALSKGALVWRADGSTTWDRNSKGLLSILEPVAEKMDLFQAYLMAKRARRLLGEGRERFVSRDEIAAMDAYLAAHPDDAALFGRVNDEWQAYNAAHLEFAVQAGYLSQAMADTWTRDADYVPFYRVLEDDVTDVRGGGTGGRALQAGEIHRLRGGESATANLFDNMIRNTAFLIEAATKNDALRRAVENLEGTGVMSRAPAKFRKSLVALADVKKQIRDPNSPLHAIAQELQAAGIDPDTLPASTWQGFASMSTVHRPEGPVVRLKVDGKNEWYTIHDPLLLRALTAVNQAQFGAWMDVFRIPKRLLTTLVTNTPTFWVANALRDTQQAYVMIKGQKVPAVAAFKGALDALRQDETFWEMMASGGGFHAGFVRAGDPAATAKIARKEMRGKAFERTVLDTPRKLADFWQDLGSAFENANRMAVYRDAEARGESNLMRAFEARDFLDFSMRGDGVAMRFLTESVPFLNARIQGLYKLARTGYENPASFFMKGALIAAASLLLWWWNKDDERFQELTDADRDTYYHFFVGEQHFRLPKGFEVGFMFGTVPERIFDSLYARGDEAGKVMLKSLIWNLHSVFAVSPPQTIGPIVEQVANRNFFRDAPIEGLADEGLPPADRFDVFTHPTTRELGAALGVSPKRLDHLIQAYGGSIGDFVVTAADQVVRYVHDYPARPSARLEDIPFVQRFARDSGPPRSTRYRAEFYDLAKSTEQAWNAYRKAVLDGNTERQAELLEDAGKLQAAGFLAATRSQLAEYNKQIRAVHASTTLDAQAKRERLDDLMAMKNRTERRAVEQGKAIIRRAEGAR